MKDIDSLLRADAAREVADDGFSGRVMRALPGHAARATPRWLRPALVMGSAIVGSGLAIAFAPPLESPAMAIVEFYTRGAPSTSAWAALALAGALLASCLVVAFADD